MCWKWCFRASRSQTFQGTPSILGLYPRADCYAVKNPDEVLSKGWTLLHQHSNQPQNRYSTRSPTSPFFCPTFFTAAILLASGFGSTSFCLWRFELSQSILIHRPRSKVNNELFFFAKTTSTSSV